MRTKTVNTDVILTTSKKGNPCVRLTVEIDGKTKTYFGKRAVEKALKHEFYLGEDTVKDVIELEEMTQKLYHNRKADEI